MTNKLWQLDDVRLAGTMAGRSDARFACDALAIRAGVTAVIGQSGAGKTSLLNLLVGFEKPDHGRVASSLPASNGQLAVFWSPDREGLWPHLSGVAHLHAVSPLPEKEKRSEADRLLDRFELTAVRDSLPGEMSQGERSRLSVARVLAARPTVMVMDEPLSGVDPTRLDRYWQVIREDVDSLACSLVFATHQPHVVLAQADRVICVENGRTIFEGDVDTLYWHPPSESLTQRLGPGNWFEPEDAQSWLGEDRSEAFCLRPEQLSIEPLENGSASNASGLARVRTATFAGSIATAELELGGVESGNLTRVFFHRPSTRRLKPGDQVSIRSLA